MRLRLSLSATVVLSRHSPFGHRVSSRLTRATAPCRSLLWVGCRTIVDARTAIAAIRTRGRNVEPFGKSKCRNVDLWNQAIDLPDCYNFSGMVFSGPRAGRLLVEPKSQEGKGADLERLEPIGNLFGRSGVGRRRCFRIAGGSAS